MKTLMTLALIFAANAAVAEVGHKAPLKADFHSMIVNSGHEKASLANDVNEDIAKQPAVSQTAKRDSKRVTDFVDVEIGWGEAPKMVDRRFDSVDSATALPHN